ncbi:hypothetical protein [Shinella sp.]|uniref:hypothetical protein n=1 Tax=Shinella sp. TaxID=1870904 RepID=UPI003F7203DD
MQLIPFSLPCIPETTPRIANDEEIERVERVAARMIEAKGMLNDLLADLVRLETSMAVFEPDAPVS